MKLCKATIYYHSSENEPTQALVETLELKDWIYYDLYDIKSTEIGEWFDDIDLNKSNCTSETYEKYFTTKSRALIQIIEAAKQLFDVRNLTKMTFDGCIDTAIIRFKERHADFVISKEDVYEIERKLSAITK